MRRVFEQGPGGGYCPQVATAPCWLGLGAGMGTAGWVLGCPGSGEGCAPGKVSAASTARRSQALGHWAELAARLIQTCHLRTRQRGGTPGAPLDPSLTQADRFLLVFRVCFCLAPFEIGYDVGGKAAASKPRATCLSLSPCVPGRGMGRERGREGARLFLLTSVPAFVTLSCRGRR